MKAKKRKLAPVRMFASKTSRIHWYRTQMIDVVEGSLESAAAAQEWVRSPAFAVQGRVP
jgi:hypothetical protein